MFTVDFVAGILIISKNTNEIALLFTNPRIEVRRSSLVGWRMYIDWLELLRFSDCIKKQPKSSLLSYHNNH